jgi:hypothetical protein
MFMLASAVPHSLHLTGRIDGVDGDAQRVVLIQANAAYELVGKA